MICKTIHGEEFQVDEEDYERFVKGYRFYIAHGYVCYSTTKDGYCKKTIHRVIMDQPPGEFIDHINQDKLDNRRQNLRTATRSENQCNRTIQSNNTSGFKGVNWHKPRQKWMARIQIENKQIYLGCYKHPIKAGMVAAIARIMVHGEYAAH